MADRSSQIEQLVNTEIRMENLRYTNKWKPGPGETQLFFFGGGGGGEGWVKSIIFA